jgi:uncharacterized membrane protein YfcA
VSIFLFMAALVGGALNAVAGGGSFIALPALLYAGVPPVSANATTTLALWPASVSSALAYRREIVTRGKRLVLLGAASVMGGLLGGLLLLRTSDSSFMRLLPWLMLLAAATFTFGGQLRHQLRLLRIRLSGHRLPHVRHDDRGLHRETAGHRAPRHSRDHHFHDWAVPLQFAIAIYGGYFGGGIGFMMLATLTMAGMTHIHQMNGLKSLLGAAINAVALAEFVAYGAIAWRPGLVMVAGGVIGGYAGASIARYSDQRYVRAFVIAVAWTMTAYFFLR